LNRQNQFREIIKPSSRRDLSSPNVIIPNPAPGKDSEDPD
jgi:hypothetical protein